MWFDIGDDLSTSPPGPWVGDISNSLLDIRRYFHPLHHVSSNFILQPETYIDLPGPTEQEGQWVSSRNLKQSLLTLPVTYGRSLASSNGPPSAFAVLSELLRFVAASQLQFLKQLELRITECVSEPDGADDKGALSQQANLVFYRRLLEEQVRKCSRAYDFVRHRECLGWHGAAHPPPGEPDSAEAIAGPIEVDFYYITDLAKELRDRCDREMTILINAANIAEVQRSMKHSHTVFKLTLLAAIYVPVSFVTSFFGMNVAQLGVENAPNIWIWAVMTVALFGSSFAFFFLTRETFQWFWRFFARAATF